MNAGPKYLIFPLLLTLVLLTESVFAQGYDRRQTRWDRYRHEIGAGLGMTAFLGELGGADAIGSDGLRDWNFNQNRPALQLDYQYFLMRNLSVRGNFLFGTLSGDDANTTEPFRRNRNLHFRANIYEFSGMLQYYILREEHGPKLHFVN